MRIIAICILLVTPTAHADARVDAHFGGGIEAGLIAREPHPVVVGEIGIAGEWIIGKNVGVGASIETVARPGFDLSAYEEDKLDLMFRWSRPDKGLRGGAGMGVRAMFVDAIDGQAQPAYWGVDWIHLDAAIALGRVTRAGFAGAIDAYFAWTFGCYVTRSDTMVERPQTVRDVRCGDSLTNTYVVGLQFAIAPR